MNLIQEVREHRREIKELQAQGKIMADGWKDQHIDALLKEIDRLTSEVINLLI